MAVRSHWPLVRPLNRLRHEDARLGKDGTGFGFGFRLLLTVVIAVAAVGVLAFVLLQRNLAQQHISNYASALRADAKAFEYEGARGTSPANGLRRVDPLLDAVAHRPGTLEAVLIDPQHVVRQALDDAKVGTLDVGPRIDTALFRGRAFSGHESGPGKSSRDFEFVVPVELPGGRYAYDVTYDHRAYDAQLAQMRTTVALIGLFGLAGIGAVFYLVGGRRLMRDHRLVLRHATRDGLTDLPNQRAFHDGFQEAVAFADRHQSPFALVLLDIDHFKLINDRHGHPHGDLILKRVAGILGGVGAEDHAYRIGGDEFALSLTHTDAEAAQGLALRLSRELGEAGVEVSIGMSTLRPGLQADVLRAEADAALYEAKRQGGGRAAHFDDIRERVFVTTSERKEAVLRLIDEGRMTTVFQPIWSFAAKRLLGVEALVRPDRSYGLSGPAEAFDIAEQIGRVHELDVLCVKHALRLAGSLEPAVFLFLNLSPLTLDLDSDENDWLRAAVEHAGLQPVQVVVEVTERFGGRTQSVIKSLTRLRQQGFKVAVDDVGTGNSGLDMLRKIEAEFVKLDRSIVTAAATERSARAVLLAMATFAHETAAFVIAEGIEDADTLRFLREIGDRGRPTRAIIRGGQGFGLGRPSPDLSPPLPAMLREAGSRELSLLGAS